MSPRQHKQFSGGKTVFRAEVNGLSVMFFFQYWYEFDIFGFKLHVSSCLRQYSNVTISIFQKQKSSVSLRLVNSTYLIKWHENVPKPTVLEFFIQKYHSIFQLLQNSFFTSHKSSSQVWGVQFDIQLITNSQKDQFYVIRITARTVETDLMSSVAPEEILSSESVAESLHHKLHTACYRVIMYMCCCKHIPSH